ncbi:MAG: alpha/beta hydrolase [Prosthecobacter sp.]
MICSCLSGGGRYQASMCQGRPLYAETTSTWQASDGATVPFCRWLPPHGMRSKGIVIAVPGLDEACVEWARLGRHLSKQGYEVFSSDLRGQGRDLAHPQRGNYHRWQRWVQDVNEFAARQKKGRNLPVAYVGQSLGSVLALAAASSAPAGNAPAALVLQSPALVLPYPPWYARPLVAVAQIATLNLARVTGPAALKLGRNVVMSNTADEMLWEMSPDRLCKGFSYRYLSACFDAGHHVRNLPARHSAPVLVQYGRSDKLFDLAQRSPQEFLDTFHSSDKELWPHPDPKANHDLLNDRLMRDVTLKKTSAWLDQHMVTVR